MKIHTFLFQNSLLRYNSHTVRFTHFEWAIQWRPPIALVRFNTFHHLAKKPVPSALAPSTPHARAPEPLVFCCFLSVHVPLPWPPLVHGIVQSEVFGLSLGVMPPGFQGPPVGWDGPALCSFSRLARPSLRAHPCVCRCPRFSFHVYVQWALCSCSCGRRALQLRTGGPVLAPGSTEPLGARASFNAAVHTCPTGAHGSCSPTVLGERKQLATLRPHHVASGTAQRLSRTPRATPDSAGEGRNHTVKPLVLLPSSFWGRPPGVLGGPWHQGGWVTRTKLMGTHRSNTAAAEQTRHRKSGSLQPPFPLPAAPTWWRWWQPLRAEGAAPPRRKSFSRKTG